MKLEVRDAYGIYEYSTILTELSYSRIFDIEREEDGQFCIVEGCDGHFSVKLTSDQLAALGRELIEMANASPTEPTFALETKEKGVWQPIETAPRDGSRILVVWLGEVEIATWNTDLENWQEWPNGDFDCGGELTHWMPLPLPFESNNKL